VGVIDGYPLTPEVLLGARRPVVLAGPGVVRTGNVDGLRELAQAAVVGVLNTWGAKGVFPWDDPHHLGTIGLQARDFELAGLGDADLIITTGLDPAEAPPARWRLAPWVEIPPARLPEAASWFGDRPPDRSVEALAKPPLWDLVAGVTQAGWANESLPLRPSRATRALAQAVGPDGLVVADPGVAGFWVARTFPTTTVGSVFVSSDRSQPGQAAAAALASRLAHPGRRVLLVADDPLDEPTLKVLATAEALGTGFGVELWGDHGPQLGPVEHARRLVELADPRHGGGDHCRTEQLCVDSGQLQAMVAAAGPVIAWPEPPVSAGPQGAAVN